MEGRGCGMEAGGKAERSHSCTEAKSSDENEPCWDGVDVNLYLFVSVSESALFYFCSTPAPRVVYYYTSRIRVAGWLFPSQSLSSTFAPSDQELQLLVVRSSHRDHLTETLQMKRNG